MYNRPRMLLLVVLSVFLLPGAQQHPMNLVFQPVTFQLMSPGGVDSDLSLVDLQKAALEGLVQKGDAAASQLICRGIETGSAIYNVAPSAKIEQLYFKPTSEESSDEQESSNRFYYTVPSSGYGVSDIPSSVPEGSFAPPAPLMASMCVSADSPRPFPVLFAPPPPPSTPSDSDFRADLPINTPSSVLIPPMVQQQGSDNMVKVMLKFPTAGGVVLDLNGVPASIEPSPPSVEDPLGSLLIRLHPSSSSESTPVDPPVDDTRRYVTEPRSGVYRIVPGEIPSDSDPTSVTLVFSSPEKATAMHSTKNPVVTKEKLVLPISASSSYVVPVKSDMPEKGVKHVLF